MPLSKVGSTKTTTAPVLEATVCMTLTEGLPVLAVSGGIEALLGFKAEEFVSSKVALKDRVHEDDADLAALLFSPEIQREALPFNIRLKHADGRFRCIRGVGWKKAGAGGEVILELLLQDAKSLCQSLDCKTMLANFKAMMENTDDFFYFKDRNHVITSARQTMFFPGDDSISWTELIGKTDYELLPEKFADAFYRLEKQVFAEKRMAREVQEFLNKEGEKGWIDHRKYPIRNESGEILGLFGIARDITEQRMADEILRESEESLRESQEIAGLGSYVLDLRTGVWTGSDVMNLVLGIGEAYERTVEGWLAVVHPDDRPMMAAHLREEVLAQGKRFDKEYRIVRLADQAVRWVHGLGRLQFDPQGHPLKLRGTIQDITERKLADAALRESKEVLQLFIEHAPAALAMFDRKMRYLAVSRRWREDNSLGDCDVVGQSYYEMTKGIPERWKEAHRRGLEGETVRADEDIFARLDGSTAWLRWEVRPWRSADGGVGGITLFAEDITAQKQTEERLQLAASVFTHAREGILITDPDGTIVEVNDTFSRITGYSRDEVLGRNTRLLKSGIQTADFYAEMWRALKERGQWSGEIWNRVKTGEIFAEMLTISAVYDEGGIVQRYVALFSDITQLKEHERKLEHIAHYDVLTGLPNRVLLADRLRQGMAQSHRQKRLLAVAYLDLDGFKAVNDRYGHEAGDQLLAALAHTMKQTLREGDTLARLGGDEFVAVLLDLADIAASDLVLDRMLAAAAEPVQVEGLSLQVSASVGVAFYPQGEDVDADQLLRQADQAMYQAKLAGRNRYHIFDPNQDLSVRGHHEDLAHIRRALAAREFVLYYQPKVNMRTGAIIGAEALIRWQHPDRGLLPPAMFLPVIEDNLLSVEMGEWVIDTALTQMERWLAHGLEFPVSVNVGALQLQQENFAGRLRAILALHPNIKPQSLELEVLETSALQDVVQVSKVINACRELGVSFALDDFGTGYSSLTYLKRLPASVLKIDQSFVREILDDAESLSILEGVLGLAAAFHRQVIAEGVETVEHGQLLLLLGCELAQGYGIARPMQAEQFPAWSAVWRPDPRWAKASVVSAEGRQALYAGVEHRAWISAIDAFLKGERHAAPGLERCACRFCAWLEGEGREGNDGLPARQAMEVIHEQIHGLAAALLDLKAQGWNTRGVAGLGELHRLQAALLGQLEIPMQSS
jgi:diguanylate cyclase (GGDEF)-like protein/PAS domain S-box-containing protein